MKDAMTDLETLGTVPGCSILSIGAVRFDPNTSMLGKDFYVVVNRQSCADAGLHEDPGTLKWWNGQSEAAKQVLRDAEDPKKSLKLADALTEFNKWIKEVSGTRVYGNGADFDNPILRVAYYVTDVPQGWAPYNGRCHRTLKSIKGVPAMAKRTGVHHNALDDAISQAEHLMAIVKHLNIELG